MPPLFMCQVLGFIISLVKIFIDFQHDLDSHKLSVVIDGDFHLPFLCSYFPENSERGGREQHQGAMFGPR